jgi:hypothetical protein
MVPVQMHSRKRDEGNFKRRHIARLTEQVWCAPLHVCHNDDHLHPLGARTRTFGVKDISFPRPYAMAEPKETRRNCQEGNHTTALLNVMLYPTLF